MSTSLKRLLEAEAARTEIPPAPVAAVVAGGQSRARRRRILTVAVAAAAAVLAIAIPIGLSRGGSDDKPIKRPEIGWTQLDGPWTDRRSIHFGDATAPRPPGWNVEVLTSTRDSALYTWSDTNGKNYRVYELRHDGSVSQIGSGVGGVPLADPTGSLVAWQDKAAGEVVVYDTSRHAEIGRQPVGPSGVLVNAVHGDTVVYTDQQTYIWRPERGAPKPLNLTLPKWSFVSGVDGRLRVVSSLTGRGESYVLDESGRKVLTLPDATLAVFDPSGRYLALARLNPKYPVVMDWAIRAIGESKDTELAGYTGEIVQTSWDPSGSLVVRTVKQIDASMLRPKDEITFYRCDPAMGDCVLIEGSTTTAAAAPEPANLQNSLLLDAPGP
ncbi:MAG TPA: hypothetical protein VKB55_15070 [Nocardioidaceae bacterium]|nr:hypothetical protein [Nocardioidaceae bacterium]